MRDYLSTFVNTLSITDVNSISNQAAMLTSLTSSTGEITRNLAVSYFDNFNLFRKR